MPLDVATKASLPDSLRDMPAFDFVLAGRYRLLAPLGEGGMAAVYRARDLRLNRDVAVKVLRDDLTRDPDFLQRFGREAQTVASLSHPNIVPVYDVGTEAGTHFIVMEYVPGRTLKEEITREGRLSPARAVAILIPVLDALAYAHGKGIIHRDVKPHNILLSADGVPRLTDFGIAYLAGGSATQTAVILGSAHYLSPEQSRGEMATTRSDIYACGVTLHEMLSGRPPFDGPNALVVANQHLSSVPPPISGLPPDLHAALVRALSKDPEARFHDAQAFASALPPSLNPDLGATADLSTTTEMTGALLPTRAAPPALARPLPSETQILLHRSQRKTALLALVAAALLAAAAYVGTLPWAHVTLPSYPSAPYALIVVLPALLILASWLRARSFLYTMDGSSAVVRWGVLGHHRFGVPIHQIATIELKQSPFDRVLGLGTVELCTRDPHGVERRLILEDLAHPRDAYEELMQALGRYIRSQQGGP